MWLECDKSRHRYSRVTKNEIWPHVNALFIGLVSGGLFKTLLDICDGVFLRK